MHELRWNAMQAPTEKRMMQGLKYNARSQCERTEKCKALNALHVLTVRELNNVRLEMHCSFSLRENWTMQGLKCTARSHCERTEWCQARLDIKCMFLWRTEWCKGWNAMHVLTEREQNNARLKMHCTFSLRENRTMQGLKCNARSYWERTEQC